MSALDATEDLDVVFAGVDQVVAPVTHEQACTTSAGSGVELLTGSKKFIGMPFPAPVHSSNTRRLFCRHVLFHESASRLLVRSDMPLAPTHQYILIDWYI